jgi:aminoglycoside phosphotransferase (APT) family kinase protein
VITAGAIGESPTGPVRDQHRFDETALLRWLEANLAGFQGPAELLQFDAGQSNPTFLLRAASSDYVLRKQPPGKLTASAHSLDREYRVLRALAGSDVPIPTALAYCEDPTHIGTQFYVMDYCPGRVFHDPLLPGVSREQRAAIYHSMSAALAALHTVDWRAAGLKGFGRPDHYVERQVARWGKQNDALGREGAGALTALREWIEANVPEDEPACIAHGDYRIGNLICALDPAGVVAVLDWELSTIGHPLADLAYSCMTYHFPAGHAASKGFIGADLAALGIPSEDEYVAVYLKRTGRDDVPHWRFFKAFSLYRMASILRGVYARAIAGNASSSTAHLVGESWRMVADAGHALVAGRGR